MANGDLEKILTLDQVVELRAKTERVSQFLFNQLKEYLETVRPLLSPTRVFGKDVPGAGTQLKKLHERYGQVCSKPFGLAPELQDNAVKDLDSRLELFPWEYSFEAKSDKEVKTVTVSSPVKYVLNYRTAYTLSQVRQVLSGRGERRQNNVQEFLVAALTIQAVLDHFPGLTRLMKDLRYTVQIDKSPDLGDLPLAVINSCVPSFRPADELVLATTRLSGVPVFVELIDVEAIHQLEDPLKPRLQGLLAEA